MMPDPTDFLIPIVSGLTPAEHQFRLNPLALAMLWEDLHALARARAEAEIASRSYIVRGDYA